ncbi:MAG: release factor glutamine methyltransferase [Candidatus Berkelbacteria bacterium Licking1014_96]|uniref:Release factor glutamine methyltransferase n=1 Tax=Candidatus Berkelbacteria bacterium Licking1014_96 TaxID=2017149 RepID=A0A554LDB7_9BACT|nr:MAG: release factor glutamine methyltransferase [Candidatus Berkelbacteria bacterium Licking1014_96]
MKIKEALGLENFSLEAEVLLVYSLKHENIKTQEQITKTFLYTNPNFKLSAKAEKKFKKLIEKRATGVPIAYLIYSKEFFGLDFYVDKNVLIPRPETEMLAEEGLKFLELGIRNQELGKTINILDLGAGSGNIVISIAKNIKKTIIHNSSFIIHFHASDISPQALKTAQKNAEKHKVKISFIKSDLFKNLPQIKFDLIIANLPYLDPNWISKQLEFEPKDALDGGRDGLKIIEEFLQQAKNHLNKKSTLLLEIDPGQVKKIKKLVKKYLPRKKLSIIKDLSQLDRIVKIN